MRISTILLLGAPALGAAERLPKMVAESVTSGKTLGPPSPEIRLTSNSTTFLGDCFPEQAFKFNLFGPSGHGAIGVEANAADTVEILFDNQDRGGNVDIIGPPESNFFAHEFNAGEDFQGVPFDYSGLEDHGEDGIWVTVKCTSDTSVVVIVNDDVDLVVEAIVTEYYDGDEIELVGDVTADDPLDGKTRGRKGAGKSPVSFDPSTGKKIKVRHEHGNKDKGIVLVDGMFTADDGRKVRRTFIRESKDKPVGFKEPKSVSVKCCDINDAGDVELSFPGLAKQGEYFRVDARFGIELKDSTEPIEVVDVTAMLTKGSLMTVHGGWIRNAFRDQGLTGISDDDWDVILLDAVVSDPSESYQIVGRMGNAISNGVAKGPGNKREKLTQAPSSEEVGVSDEMRAGKKPKGASSNDNTNGLRRNLPKTTHKKILVHGYCSNASPFDSDDFTNFVEFSHPDAPNSWTNDVFARHIADFADAQGLDGCGCIGHSQAGNACTHLYTYYFSCLDEANQGGSKLIQSVGTPYQGTALAGNLAALGDVFGVGCGSNTDLSYSGATAWLSNIPSWARSQVTYYTTSFATAWWRWDYCHLATDLLLSGDEDGTTERTMGQLPGAINGGHKKGYCHISGMRDPSQTLDHSRNAQLNSQAKF